MRSEDDKSNKVSVVVTSSGQRKKGGMKMAMAGAAALQH